LADLLVICPVGLIIYIVTYLITKESRLLLCAGLCVLIFIIAKSLYPQIVKTHMNLSNDQLSYITDMKKKELREKLLLIINS
jgi:hypothetical protein